MKPVRIKINRKGAEAILKSEGVRADLERRARAIAAAAGGDTDDYEASSYVGVTRARASVVTATFEARKAEAEDRRLSSAIEAGRA